MKKVKEETSLPNEKLIELLPKIDFWDVFSTTNHVDSLKVITDKIFNSPPQWVKAMMSLRNSVAGLIGLKYDMPADYKSGFEQGAYVSFFKVFTISDDEVVLGADDSHLNFRAVITRKGKSEKYNIHVTTLVEFNNAMGKRYMALIAPFHRMVIKRMIRNAFVDIENTFVRA